jgi:hypothetical protein
MRSAPAPVVVRGRRQPELKFAPTDTVRDAILRATFWLTYQASDFAELDLWSRQGFKLVMKSQDGLLVDYQVTGEIIHDLFQPIAKRSGEVKEPP